MYMKHKYDDLILYRRLLAEARPYWPHITGLFALQLLSTPLALLTPLPLKITVDSVIGSQSLPDWLNTLVPATISGHTNNLLIFAAGLLLVVTLLTYLQNLATWLLQVYTGEKLLLGFRAKLFRHIQELPFSYHDSKGSTDSLYRIQYDTNSIQNAATKGVIPFLSGSVTLVAMMWITVHIDWYLALVAITIIPMLFLLTNASRRILRRHWSAYKSNESSAMSVIQETLSALRVVKAFGKEAHENERFLTQSGKVVRQQIRVAFTEGVFNLLIGCTMALGTALVLVIGVHHVKTGMISLGNLLLVMTYLAQLYAPLQTISKQIAQLQSSIAGAERVFDVLDQEPHVTEHLSPQKLSRAEGGVEFRAVSFGYVADELILRDVSFKVPPGTRVGICGTTGAGKTTLVSLMLRFYDPIKGEILLDGIDLRNCALLDLRSQFAMVLQDPVLFSASIAENIAYSRPNASEQDIIEAAKSANAHEFITRLPQGYDTLVGERGMRLSGGERQRISLARAFLRNAPILVFDEPTSSVDTRTEEAIMDAMHRLMVGRTTFMIAHRLSTLDRCDMWLRLEQGHPIQVLQSQPVSYAAEKYALMQDGRGNSQSQQHVSQRA
jgi:ATP-binding cassette subfamily B protein